VSQETRSLNTKVRSTDDRVELGDLLPDQRFDPEATALQTTVRAELVTALARCLTDREQRFLRTYLGFDTGQKATLEAIGQHEGLTRERVRQVIAEALAKLRDDPSIRAYAPTPE
jgi:RNA polymerase primary sigma factor